MTTHVRHRGDRLVVPFEGELDWPRATDASSSTSPGATASTRCSPWR